MSGMRRRYAVTRADSALPTIQPMPKADSRPLPELSLQDAAAG
jgi:hypothetical protein